MAHHITATDTMFSVGSTPWHGLGTVIHDAPSIADAIKLAGLDWSVQARPNFAQLPDGSLVATPSQSIVKVNADGSYGPSLGSVGPAYVPLQNEKAFAWFQPWLDAKQATLETAGSLDAGSRVWVLAKLAGDPIVVKGDDVVERYLLLAHAHDGSLAIRAGLTPVRVVCHNTLTAAIGGRGASVDGIFKITHRANAQAQLDLVAMQVEAIDKRLTAVGEAYRRLTEIPVKGGDQLVEFLGAVYRQTTEEVRKGRRLDEITSLFEGGKGQDLPGAKGTAWGLFNAITEYHTHVAGKTSESRANANAFGAGAGIIARALEVGLSLGQRTWDIDEVFGVGSAASTLATSEHPNALVA